MVRDEKKSVARFLVCPRAPAAWLNGLWPLLLVRRCTIASQRAAVIHQTAPRPENQLTAYSGPKLEIIDAAAAMRTHAGAKRSPRSTSAMLPPTTEGEPTQCHAKAAGAGASLAMMATLGFLWGGACFGFNGIKTVFLDEGLFADACDHGDRCKAQINQVDAAWTFASAMLNVMALVNGSLSDALGLRRLCLLSSALLAISGRVLPRLRERLSSTILCSLRWWSRACSSPSAVSHCRGNGAPSRRRARGRTT